MFYLYWTGDMEIEFDLESWDWNELGPFESLEEVKQELEVQQKYDEEHGLDLRYVIGEFKVIYPEVAND